MVAPADLLSQGLAVQQQGEAIARHQVVDVELENNLPDPFRPTLDVV